jgi:hypothetical protein
VKQLATEQQQQQTQQGSTAVAAQAIIISRTSMHEYAYEDTMFE